MYEIFFTNQLKKIISSVKVAGIKLNCLIAF